jgi:hypothetical protein
MITNVGSPYRDTDFVRLKKLPNEHTYIRIDDVIAVEEQRDIVVLRFRNGDSLTWKTDAPAALAQAIAETINTAP